MRRNFLEQRREAIEEFREEREQHRFGHREDRAEHLRERREDRGERLHERRGDRGESHPHERREDHHRHDQDSDIPHYAPPAGPPPGERDLNRADLVSDDDFQGMMRNRQFENSRIGGAVGPEDSGEWDRSRPPTNSGYQPSYQQPHSQAYQRYPEPPAAHEQRPSGYGHQSDAYPQPPRDNYSVPESSEPRHGNSPYAPPVGAPGAHSPAGSYSSPPGPPPQARPSYGCDTSQIRGRTGGGAASEYYDGPAPDQQAHSYSHIPEMAAAHNDSSNPALYQQYHEAAQGLQTKYQAQRPDASAEFDEEKYKSHFTAHAQAYGSDSNGRRMENDDIGAAAAVEALKITAANNRQSNSRPQQGGRPQGGFLSETDAPQGRPSDTQQSGRPSSGQPQGRPQSEQESGSGWEDEGPTAKPQAPTGGGGPQDKIIALAMAQAGKLFDKKGGGDSQGKTQAMQTAATTAMRMMTEYKSTGKVNMQPGEMQKLMGLAMSLF